MRRQRASDPARLATLSGLMAILLWSSLALMTVFTAALPPFQVLALTFAIGGAGAVLQSRLEPGFATSWRQPWSAFGLAVLALFGYHALYFVAFRLAPAVEVNLINYLWPLLIVFFAAFLPGVNLRLWQVVGTVCGLGGVVLMLGHGHGINLARTDLPGYLAALGAALVWSAYSVLNRRFQAVPSSAMGVNCLVVALIAACVHLAFEHTVAPDPMQWLILILMGLGPVGVAFRLWDRGTKHGDLALLGTLSYAAPVLSTLLLLGSGKVQAHWSQAAAVAMLLLGAWLSARSSAGTGRVRVRPFD